MGLSWSGRRQFLYYGVAFVVVAVLFYVGYRSFFTSAATCFDGKRDGDETGVDCGGSICSLVCPSDARAPVVLWARAFKVSEGDYTAAAYVENPNVGAGARQVSYSFQLFDAQNSFIIEKDGVVDLPPIETIPIIEPTISTGSRIVSRALFAFGGTPVWNKVSSPALHVDNVTLAPDATRVTATLINDSIGNLSNVTVDAVLFDGAGTAQAASKSVVSVPGHGSVPLVFTWPQAQTGVVRAELTILPPF